jgi:adenylyl-sulfate kinase
MAEAPRSANVVWQHGETTRAARWAAMGGPGATVWLTGLPASGKSTLASALEAELLRGGRAAYVLDGDNLRHGLNGDLGFSAEDRAENVRRTAEVAALIADAGVVCLAALVSPYAADRQAARTAHERRDLTFLEVHVATSLAECERRDPKGLYARAAGPDRRRCALRGAGAARPAGRAERAAGGGDRAPPGHSAGQLTIRLQVSRVVADESGHGPISQPDPGAGVRRCLRARPSRRGRCEGAGRQPRP